MYVCKHAFVCVFERMYVYSHLIECLHSNETHAQIHIHTHICTQVLSSHAIIVINLLLYPNASLIFVSTAFSTSYLRKVSTLMYTQDWHIHTDVYTYTHTHTHYAWIHVLCMNVHTHLLHLHQLSSFLARSKQCNDIRRRLGAAKSILDGSNNGLARLHSLPVYTVDWGTEFLF